MTQCLLRFIHQRHLLRRIVEVLKLKVSFVRVEERDLVCRS